MVKKILEEITDQQPKKHYDLIAEEILYLIKQDPRVYPIIREACYEVLQKYKNNIAEFCRQTRIPRQSAYNLFERCNFNPPKYKPRKIKLSKNQ